MLYGLLLDVDMYRINLGNNGNSAIFVAYDLNEPSSRLFVHRQ